MSDKAPKKVTQYTTVKMTDGRIVDFAGKTRLKKSFEIVDGKVTITLDFVNGETRLFTVPDEMVLRFAAHGADQKLGDETAGVPDLDDAIMGVDELIDRLYNGEWGAKREASALAGSSILAKALVEQSGKSAAEVKAFLLKKSHAEKVALRTNPAIAPIVARLEATKSDKAKSKSATIDTESLLGELAA